MAVDDPAPLRLDVFGEGGPEAVVPLGVDEQELLVLGWFASEADQGARGAHLALRRARQDDAGPARGARQPRARAGRRADGDALRLTQLWERDGEAYWAGQATAGGRGPQDPEGARRRPAPRPVRSDEERAARRREKAALLERVHEQAPEVLAAFVGARDEAQAAERLAAVLGTTPEVSLELVTHLQFRELTEQAARQPLRAPHPPPGAPAPGWHPARAGPAGDRGLPRGEGSGSGREAMTSTEVPDQAGGPRRPGSEALLAQLLATAPVALLHLDLDGVVTTALGTALSVDPDQLVGQRLLDLAETAEQADTPRRALAGEEVTAVVQWGDRSWQARYRPFLEHGVRTGTVGVYTDITEQVLAEQARAAGEAHLRAVLETAREAILVVDLDGRVTMANRRCAQLLGGTAVVGRDLRQLVDRETAAALDGQLRAPVPGLRGPVRAPAARPLGRRAVAARQRQPADRPGRRADRLGRRAHRHHRRQGRAVTGSAPPPSPTP